MNRGKFVQGSPFAVFDSLKQLLAEQRHRIFRRRQRRACAGVEVFDFGRRVDCLFDAELWALIDREASGGAPALRVHNALPVPVLPFTAEWQRFDRAPAGQGIRPAVARYLAAERRGAEAVSRSAAAQAQLRHLSVAAFRDIGGWSEGEVAAAYSKPARVARRDASIGRQLWVALGAWPWWPIAAGFADRGEGAPRWDFSRGLPIDWWRLPRVVAALAAWAAGTVPRSHNRRLRELIG